MANISPYVPQVTSYALLKALSEARRRGAVGDPYGLTTAFDSFNKGIAARQKYIHDEEKQELDRQKAELDKARSEREAQKTKIEQEEHAHTVKGRQDFQQALERADRIAKRGTARHTLAVEGFLTTPEALEKIATKAKAARDYISNIKLSHKAVKEAVEAKEIDRLSRELFNAKVRTSAIRPDLAPMSAQGQAAMQAQIIQFRNQAREQAEGIVKGKNYKVAIDEDDPTNVKVTYGEHDQEVPVDMEELAIVLHNTGNKEGLATVLKLQEAQNKRRLANARQTSAGASQTRAEGVGTRAGATGTRAGGKLPPTPLEQISQKEDKLVAALSKMGNVPADDPIKKSLLEDYLATKAERIRLQNEAAGIVTPSVPDFVGDITGRKRTAANAYGLQAGDVDPSTRNILGIPEMGFMGNQPMPVPGRGPAGLGTRSTSGTIGGTPTVPASAFGRQPVSVYTPPPDADALGIDPTMANADVDVEDDESP